MPHRKHWLDINIGPTLKTVYYRDSFYKILFIRISAEVQLKSPKNSWNNSQLEMFQTQPCYNSVVYLQR